MERRELEDRIRASLEARANDVQPTPELWERVSEQTTRRTRWQLAGWVLSGAAAVLAIVVGGVVLLGSPRGVSIDPEPDVATSPDQLPDTSDTVAPTIVTTDGQRLFVLEAGTGEVVTELDPREGLVEPAQIRSVAVRPSTDDGLLTVASVIEIEGTYDIDVSVHDLATGERVDRQPIGMGASAGDLPPDVVWSQDGRYLMWAGSSVSEGTVAGPALWAYDWTERPVDDQGTAQPVPVTPPGADDALFASGSTVDLHTWTGPSEGESVVVASTPTGQAWRIGLAARSSDCEGATPCPPTWTAAISPFGMEGGSLVDHAVLASGVELSLVARGGDGADAESGTLALLAGAMSDQQRELDVPELTSGTAAPGDGWLAAAGSQVAVGHGPQAFLLTVEGTLVEDTAVGDTAALPDGTVAAGMALGAAPASASSTGDPGPTETASPTIAADGVPTHVVVSGPGSGRLALVDRATGDELATWQRPDSVVAEAVSAQVVVHPASTATDLEVVTRWTVGESEVLVRTVVRDGQVLVNDELPADVQATNQGSIAEMADSAPVFSPTGDWLAFAETPDGADGPVRLRIVPWGSDGPAGNASTVDVPAEVARPVELVDWAATPSGDVLTFRPMAQGAESFDEPAAMVEFRLGGADPRAGQWATVELPGILFDAGSFRFEDGGQRYIAFDGGDDVLYGLADAPESAVPTGAFAFSEGRVVAFGPDSALVQQADGSWQRVQVDDGATSRVEMPDGTVAVLPWR